MLVLISSHIITCSVLSTSRPVFLAHFGDVAIRATSHELNGETWSFGRARSSSQMREGGEGAERELFDGVKGGIRFFASSAAGGKAQVLQNEVPDEIAAFTNALLLTRFEELGLAHDLDDDEHLLLPPAPAPDEEVVAACDAETGRDLLALPRSYALGRRILMRGVGILVRNLKGEIYVHRRAANKKHFPSMLDMWVGGMASFGEPAETTARRELREELGVGGGGLLWNLSTVVRTDLNQVFVDCFEYTLAESEEIRHVDGEVAWGTFTDAAALAEMMAAEPFVPDGLQCWRAYQERLHAGGGNAERSRSPPRAGVACMRLGSTAVERRGFIGQVTAVLSAAIGPWRPHAASAVLEGLVPDSSRTKSYSGVQNAWDKAGQMTQKEIFMAARGAGNVKEKLKNGGVESLKSQKRRAMAGCKEDTFRDAAGGGTEAECNGRVLGGETAFMLKVLDEE